MKARWHSLTLAALLMLVMAICGFGCDEGNGIVPIDGDKVDGDDVVDGDDDSTIVKPGDYAPCDSDADCNAETETCLNQTCRKKCDADTPCAINEVCMADICELNCDNKCIEKDGFYCDFESQLCKTVDCTPCSADREAFYCGTDGTSTCTTVTYDGVQASYCLQNSSTGCPDGYYDKLGKCYPKAYCEGFVEARAIGATEYPGSVPGGPCAFGSLFPGHSCAGSGSCIGNPALEDNTGPITCETTQDCVSWAAGISNVTGDVVYCAGGVCGFSFCVAPCSANGSCPDLEGLDDLDFYPGDVSGSCYCGPYPLFQKVGDAPLGSICDSKNEPDLPLCGDAFECFALNQSKVCQDDDECTEFGANSYCNALGKCAYSFCSEGCVDDKCPGTANYVPGQNRCYCTAGEYAQPVGDAAADEKCNGGVKQELAHCQDGLHCRVWSDKLSTTCTEDSECPQATWGPNAFCSDDGYCSFSICATPCTEGECPDGMSRIEDGPVNLCVCTASDVYGKDTK